MFPTFLGIGVNKAGTTWLHDLLDSHPHIWMPSRRKEVNFFTRHYDKGLDWYERFFPDSSESEKYKEIGEFTPSYLYGDECPYRISKVSSIQSFILSLRNPVDRVYSAYGHSVRNHNTSYSFEQFLDAKPHQVERGLYASHFKNYLRYFDRDQFLILRFENLFSNVAETRKKLADFLGVDPDLFPKEAGKQQRNVTFIPRFRTAFAVAQCLIRTMKRWELGRVLELLRRTGIGPFAKRLFGQQQKEDVLPSIQPETKARLARRYLSDIGELEKLTGLEFSDWKRDLSL